MPCPSSRRFLSIVSTCLFLLLLFSACQQQSEPLKIGYIGGLTGRVAGLGVAGRDGVLMAVEERNRAGGLDGRKLELVAMDDQQDAKVGEKTVRELIAGDAVAIVGPMTSSMAEVMQPWINQAKIVMVSPTVTSNRFNGQDDYFFRVTMPLRVNAEKQAAYAMAQGLKTFAVAVETGNASFTEDWLESFRQAYEPLGGRILCVERFKSGAEGGFLPLAKRLIEKEPDGLLLLCGAIDAAMIAQQVRKLGSKVALFGSEWAFTSDVISFGGDAVEEMKSFVTFNPVSTSPKNASFVVNFEKRFGYKPSFAGVLAYEATQYLFAGLERNPRREGLKEALNGVSQIAGLQGDVRFDRFGDPQRQTYLAVIRNQLFSTLD